MLENQKKSYVGIDVSKANLDVCFGDKKAIATYSNSAAGIKKLMILDDN